MSGSIIATKAATGATRIAGLLPDGRPFSAAGYLRDNNTIAFYTKEIDGTNPSGFLGGELTAANLTKTDVTGEIAWIKPPQRPGALGNELGGVNTILTANGSIFTGTIPLAGPGTLTLSGGNLAATQSSAVTVTAGIPAPIGALRAWTVAVPASGRFAAKVLIPGSSALREKASAIVWTNSSNFSRDQMQTIQSLLPGPTVVNGSGIYLPKSNSAWGYFRGKTDGGRIELTVP